VKYYINPLNNALYDGRSYELVGRWDERKKEIIEVIDDSED